MVHTGGTEHTASTAFPPPQESDRGAPSNPDVVRPLIHEWTTATSSTNQRLADLLEAGEQIPDFEAITSGEDIEVPLTFVDDAGVEPVTGSITITGDETVARVGGAVGSLGTASAGGTVSGVGRYLKAQNPKIQIVAFEPASSPLLTEGRAGPHGLQGIGANFVPENLDRTVLDEILTVTDADAYAAGRELARTEGILVGITSGAAVWAAAQLAMRPENAGKTIVALLPDSGERYLSTPMFRD